MNFRKNSASVLLGVMALGFSSQMLVSAVDENSNFENKTLQTVSNDPLASDLKNENEGSCLSVDNTNEDVNFIYTDGLTKDESGLSKNSKIVLGAISSLAAFGGIGYAVKKVVDKKISQNQEAPEQQVDDKDVGEENEENNNQDSGNSDNAGNTKISSQDQTLEKRKSNSGNVMLIVFGVVAFIIIIAVVVVTLVLKYKKKVNEFNDSGNHDEVNNDEVNNFKVLINAYKNNNELLLKYLEDNEVDKNSLLSEYISKYYADIGDYIKTLSSKDEIFIARMATLCGFDGIVATVFRCFSYYFDKKKKFSDSDARTLAYNLAKDLFIKKLNEVKSVEELDKLGENFKQFAAYFNADLFGAYAALARFSSDFKKDCKEKRSQLEGNKAQPENLEYLNKSY